MTIEDSTNAVANLIPLAVTAGIVGSLVHHSEDNYHRRKKKKKRYSDDGWFSIW
jgi:hypothetical protein